MPHELRKIRKKRGSRTQGYGRVGQHRKSGGKGGRKPGRHKHGWSYVQRYKPDYFKKNRFKSLRSRTENIINLKQLEEIASQLSPKRKARKTKILVDLKEMGYAKLLGTGKITLPVSVKVPSCSEAALRKIEEAGGQVLTEKD
ncbi:MAG: 50S ribosomal protein L15 [Candidatus Bathyarchaeota archaeon]|nr:50S ribosomal protein L15 [Candidatus Bathyarchaeota archaeon]